MFTEISNDANRDFHVFENVDQLIKIVRSLFHNSFESAIVCSPEVDGHKIISVNPAFCKMTGYTEAELIGQSPKMLQGSKTNMAIMGKLKNQIREAKPFHGAAINYKKDGTAYHVEWKINPVYDLEGNLLCFFSLQRDLTYLKSFLNRIKLTSEHVRELLKNVNKIPIDEDANANLKDSIANTTREEVSNAALFSPSLRDDADIDLFDSELFMDDEKPAGIMPIERPQHKVSAEQFHQENNIDKEDILQLCSIIEDCINGANILSASASHAYTRQSLVRDLQEFANVLFFMDEFVDISSVIGEVARKLNDYKEPEFAPFVIDILEALLIELNAWVTSIFIDRSSSNIHELDDSLIGSAKQLLVFL